MASLMLKALLFGRAFFLLMLFVFTIIGIAGPLFAHKDRKEYYVSVFNMKDHRGEKHSTASLGCEKVKSHLQGMGAMGILCVFAYTFLFFNTIVELCYGNKQIINASFFVIHALSCFFMLVCWALGAAVYNQSMCGFKPSASDMKIEYALSLLVVTWVFQLLFVTALKFLSNLRTADEAEEEDTVAAGPNDMNDPYKY